MSQKKVVLIFHRWQLDKPITYRLVKDYNLVMNILRAKVTPKEGKLVLGLQGRKENIEQGLKFLEDQGVIIQSLVSDIRLNKEKCVDCGACLAVCKPGALTLNQKTQELELNKDKCILCEQCVEACPLGAIEIYF